MIHALDHKNNTSMGFPMSESLGIDTLILIIPAILAGEDAWILDFHI